MKKTVSLCLAMAMVLCLLGGCSGSGKDTAAPKLPENAALDTVINVTLDGVPTAENGYAYADIVGKFGEIVIGDNTYYGIRIADLTGADLTDCKGAFLEAYDGFIRYVSDVRDLTLAAFVAGEDGYDYIEYDGRNIYQVIAADGTVLDGAENIYLVTTPADFAVDIQINGESVGTMTIAEFLKKTHTESGKIPTAMYDGAFKYNQGSSTYKGRFLGIDFDTMIAKISNMEGVEIPGEIKEVEYYGTPGMGQPGKNTEYTQYPDENTYWGFVEFFCMYDGMTINPDIKDIPVGLTAFTNGTGMRWVTYDLTAINIVTE